MNAARNFIPCRGTIAATISSTISYTLKKHNTAFKLSYTLRFVPKFTSHIPSGRVTADKCRSCVAFGRVPLKHGRVTNAVCSRKDEMVFKIKFRTDSFVQHLNLIHRDLWMQYRNLPDEEKMKFLDRDEAFAETKPSFFENTDELEITSEAEIIFDITKRLFCVDNTKYGLGNSVTQLLRRLISTLYHIVVNNLMKFQRVIGFVAQEQPFR